MNVQITAVHNNESSYFATSLQILDRIIYIICSAYNLASSKCLTNVNYYLWVFNIINA